MKNFVDEAIKMTNDIVEQLPQPTCNTISEECIVNEYWLNFGLVVFPFTYCNTIKCKFCKLIGN
jgi:hypothetical protein